MGKSPYFMGKTTISMAIFNSYVNLPEGINSINGGCSMMSHCHLWFAEGSLKNRICSVERQLTVSATDRGPAATLLVNHDSCFPAYCSCSLSRWGSALIQAEKVPWCNFQLISIDFRKLHGSGFSMRLCFRPWLPYWPGHPQVHICLCLVSDWVEDSLGTFCNALPFAEIHPSNSAKRKGLHCYTDTSKGASWGLVFGCGQNLLTIEASCSGFQ